MQETVIPSPASGRGARGAALGLALVLLGVYGLTASKLRFGYEGANIEQAEALLRGAWSARPQGGIDPYTQGGLADVLAYAPFAAGKLALEAAGALFGLRQLAYTFAIPAWTTLLLLVLFGLARELYGRASTALGVSLIAGLATTLWPYAKFGMETQQTLWTLAATWALVHYARRPSVAAAGAFGASLALLLMTKVTGPVHAAALLAAAAWIALTTRPEAGGADAAPLWRQPGFAKHAAVAAALAGLGAAAFLLSNRWRYGGWLWRGRYGMDFELSPYPLGEALWAAAASPGESLLLFSPPLIVGLWFWGAFWRRFPALRPVWVVLLAVALLHLRNRPWADETWGPRRLHYLVPLLALPLGVWLESFRGLRRPMRWLGAATVAAGVLVQLVAVSFDYTAQAFVMGRTPLFSQENTVWDPQLAPLRFNLHLLGSARQRAAGGTSRPFVYERHYLPWTRPESPPPPEVFPVTGRDRLDLWFLQQRADWPGKPYWFRSPSSFLVPVLALMALGGAVLVRRNLRPG